MRSGENDFDLIRTLFYIKNQTSNSLAGPMSLAHYLFPFRHKPFCPVAQINNQCSTFVSHDRAAYDFTFSLDKLRIDTIPFVGPYLLYHYLLGCLSGDAAELPYIDFFIVLEGVDLPGGPVDIDDYFALRLTKMLPDRRDHSFFQIHKHGFPVDIFIACNVIHDSY